MHFVIKVECKFKIICKCFYAGLRLMALEVPQLVISGEETTLTCVFDLEDDTLYSIKWYRDDLEFFRYVPSDKPPNQFFPLQGLDIDVSIFQ